MSTSLFRGPAALATTSASAGLLAPDAAFVVATLLAAFERGDRAEAARLIAEDVVYLNLNERPFEIRGREGYLAFLASVDRLYTAPRAHELVGVVPITSGMACLHGTVKVGDVTVGGLLLHVVRDGLVTDVLDVADDRARGLRPFIDEVELAKLIG